MARYLKQRDGYSCGPVAIMNVVKWAGLTFSYKNEIKFFQSICGCRPVFGTNHSNFEKALYTIAREVEGLKVKRVYKPKLWQIEDHLGAGGIIILNYYWKRAGTHARHFMILNRVSNSGKSFLTINDYRAGPAARWTSRETFKRVNLRFQRTDSLFKAWFISRKGLGV